MWIKWVNNIHKALRTVPEKINHYINVNFIMVTNSTSDVCAKGVPREK